MPAAIMCIAFLVPSLLATSLALRVKPELTLPVDQPPSTAPILSPQQHDQNLTDPQAASPQELDTGKMEYDVDATAIVFAASFTQDDMKRMVADACAVTHILMSNGMPRQSIKLFLPHRDHVCPNGAEANIEPDFTTGCRFPVEALITGREDMLVNFCRQVAALDPHQRCSQKLLPTSENLFFFFAGHGVYDPPGIIMDSFFSHGLTSERNIWGAHLPLDVSLMLPKYWRRTVASGVPGVHGRLLAVLDACHGAVSFLTMLPTTSDSDALKEEKKHQMNRFRGRDDWYYGANADQMMSESIPFVVITSTGLQECSSFLFGDGGYFTLLMSDVVWEKADYKETVADKISAIKHWSKVQQATRLHGLADAVTALRNGESPRTFTSPKFFGFPKHLESFKWRDFKLAPLLQRKVCC